MSGGHSKVDEVYVMTSQSLQAVGEINIQIAITQRINW